MEVKITGSMICSHNPEGIPFVTVPEGDNKWKHVHFNHVLVEFSDDTHATIHLNTERLVDADKYDEAWWYEYNDADGVTHTLTSLKEYSDFLNEGLTKELTSIADGLKQSVRTRLQEYRSTADDAESGGEVGVKASA